MLHTQTYKSVALVVKTKEMLGLVASMALHCDDCISYHVSSARGRGAARAVFRGVRCGLVVGGSIVIHHLRRAVDMLDQLESGAGSDSAACADHT